jgi:glycosyltransferase involved in cell wall biosynthesis
MNILFLDQTGKIGGAEICLLDIAKPYRKNCLVGLFTDGPFKDLLEKQQIPVQVLSKKPIQVHKDSGFLESLKSLGQLIPLILRVANLSRNYDLIYANTQKALIVGAIASFISRRSLVFHLHDILSEDHFSVSNRFLSVITANYFASLIIADSKATLAAFVAAGGREHKAKMVYYGFEAQFCRNLDSEAIQLRTQFDLQGKFVVGHFSRLSPWKGQHVLIEALTHCDQNVIAVFVGDALFGEQDYVEKLHQQVAQLGLSDRVRFLGFRSDVSELMSICDLIAHTSTSAEPFGRVIVEGMLCSKPVVAAAAGGAVEIVEHGQTGWLTPPGDALKLAEVINLCFSQPELAIEVAQQAQQVACQRFDMATTNQEIAQLLHEIA